MIATPGHTSDDVSLIVQNTANGTLLVAGEFRSVGPYVILSSSYVARALCKCV